MNKQIIILAAGKGSRMNSELPKVMHDVGGTPMLEHVVNNCYKVTKDLVLVYSDHIKEFLPNFADRCKFVLQEEQLGTAHAVSVASNMINNDVMCAVIYGDNPLITPQIINDLFDHAKSSGSAVVTLAFQYDQPNAYGKIVLDSRANFTKIVESKFASDAEKAITLCNSGIMTFAPSILKKYLEQCLIPDNSSVQKELYLTKIIEICSSYGEKVSYFESQDHHLVLGVNTQEELIAANKLLVK